MTGIGASCLAPEAPWTLSSGVRGVLSARVPRQTDRLLRSSQHHRFMLDAMLAIVTAAVARASPTVRITRPIGSFWSQTSIQQLPSASRMKSRQSLRPLKARPRVVTLVSRCTWSPPCKTSDVRNTGLPAQ